MNALRTSLIAAAGISSIVMAGIVSKVMSLGRDTHAVDILACAASALFCGFFLGNLFQWKVRHSG